VQVGVQLEGLRMGLRSIRAHKLRSALTMLGVIFGVAAVVAMLAIAGGAPREAVEQIRLLGTNNLRVNQLKLTGKALEEAEQKGSAGLTTTDAELLASSLRSLRGVSPVRFVDAPVLWRGRESAARVVATNADYTRVTDFRAGQGRFLSPLDVADGKRVAVLGASVAQDLFGFQRPMGRRIRRRGLVHGGRRDGVSAREGRASVIRIRDINRDVYIPISTAQAASPARDEGAIEGLAIQLAPRGVPSLARSWPPVRLAHHGGDFEVVVRRAARARRPRSASSAW
jgi:putative ABC transport system permease protein